MHQHFEQGLVSDALSRREFARLCDVRLRQAQRYLNAGAPVQLADKTRPFRRGLLFGGARRHFCFKNSRPGRLAHQSASSASFLNVGIAIGFFFIVYSPRNRRAR